jgi:hypothetical protein
MQLQDFVSGALLQILNGIRDAQVQGAALEAVVSPDRIYGHTQGLRIINDERPIHEVAFDVAVTSEEGKSKKGGIGIVVASVALGTQGQADSKNTSVSRISFSVPVVYPVQSTKKAT